MKIGATAAVHFFSADPSVQSGSMHTIVLEIRPGAAVTSELYRALGASSRGRYYGTGYRQARESRTPLQKCAIVLAAASKGCTKVPHIVYLPYGTSLPAHMPRVPGYEYSIADPAYGSTGPPYHILVPCVPDSKARKSETQPCRPSSLVRVSTPLFKNKALL